jgi:phage tail-like protein
MRYRSFINAGRILLITSVLFLIAGSLFYAEGAVRRVGINKFLVEIDGLAQGGFIEVSGIESGIDMIEETDRTATPIANVNQRPGKTRYSNIVLKRGFINDPALYNWYKQVVRGETERKSGAIIVLDRAGNEALRYNFFESWPCRWKGPVLDTKGGDREFVEEIELCVEKWERQ